MHGRQRAYQRELQEVTHGAQKIVYVPPVSILNAVDFEVLGEPEVCLIQSDEQLMKWSCLYKASLSQDSMNVANFPHDQHDLVLRLAILKHRQRRKRWDKHRWKLDLATRNDTQDSIRIPHGLIVTHVKVPGFGHGSKGEEGELQFEFVPMELGHETSLNKDDERDQCLQVKLRVERESSYYDRNIIPLLAALNYVAICTLALDGSQFGAHGEMILAISFVEIGIRMTVDSRLPVVGYQIKMQFILNNFFFGLLALVAESSASYLMYNRGFVHHSQNLDFVAAICSVLHLIYTLAVYYSRMGDVVDRTFLSVWNKQSIMS